MITKIKKIRKDNNLQGIVLSVVIGIVILGIVSFFVVSNLRIGQKRTDLTKEIKELQREIQLLEEKNSNLRAGIVETEDDAYWEEKMREQGYKKPGEEAVVVLPANGETEGVVKEEKGFWGKLLEKLGF